MRFLPALLNFRSRFFCAAIAVAGAALTTDAGACTGSATTTQTVNFGTLLALSSYAEGTPFSGDNPKTISISVSCPPINNPSYPNAVVTYSDSVNSSGSWGASNIPGVFKSSMSSSVGIGITAAGYGVTYPVLNYIVAAGPNCFWSMQGSFSGVFCQSYGTSGGTFNYQENLTFKLVKLAGTVPVGPFTVYLMDMRIMGWVVGTATTLNPYIVSPIYGTGTFVSPTCSINTPNQTVTLNEATAAQLNTVGAVAGTKAFSIELVCQGGMTVNTTFTDTNAPGNTTNVLTNSVAATQAGVGLQILRNGTPVNFGTAIPITYVAANGTAVNIPLEARYIRKAGTVTAGQVQGIFTYTLTYQ